MIIVVGSTQTEVHITRTVIITTFYISADSIIIFVS